MIKIFFRYLSVILTGVAFIANLSACGAGGGGGGGTTQESARKVTTDMSLTATVTAATVGKTCEGVNLPAIIEKGTSLCLLNVNLTGVGAAISPRNQTFAGTSQSCSKVQIVTSTNKLVAEVTPNIDGSWSITQDMASYMNFSGAIRCTVSGANPKINLSSILRPDPSGAANAFVGTEVTTLGAVMVVTVDTATTVSAVGITSTVPAGVKSGSTVNGVTIDANRAATNAHSIVIGVLDSTATLNPGITPLGGIWATNPGTGSTKQAALLSAIAGSANVCRLKLTGKDASGNDFSFPALPVPVPPDPQEKPDLQYIKNGAILLDKNNSGWTFADRAGNDKVIDVTFTPCLSLSAGEVAVLRWAVTGLEDVLITATPLSTSGANLPVQ